MQSVLQGQQQYSTTIMMLRPKRGNNVQPFQFEPTYDLGEDRESELESCEDSFYQENERLGNTDWCECSECVCLQSENECFCCQELDVLNDKFDDSGVDCIIEHPKFAVVCLDKDVLSTALIAIHSTLCNPVPDPIENNTLRLAAYKQFTWWAHGVLGKKRRRVIPSCVVNKIRDTFPEECDEDYTGFQEAEVNL